MSYWQTYYLILSSTNKALKWIDLVFLSNFFRSLVPEREFISFQLYWCMNGIIFATLSACTPILWSFNAVVSGKNIIYNCFLGLLLLLCFWSNLSFYELSATVEACCMTFIKHSINQMKHKFTIFHCLQSFLVFMQKRIWNLSDDFICTFTNHNF